MAVPLRLTSWRMKWILDELNEYSNVINLHLCIWHLYFFPETDSIGHHPTWSISFPCLLNSCLGGTFSFRYHKLQKPQKSYWTISTFLAQNAVSKTLTSISYTQSDILFYPESCHHQKWDSRGGSPQVHTVSRKWGGGIREKLEAIINK